MSIIVLLYINHIGSTACPPYFTRQELMEREVRYISSTWCSSFQWCDRIKPNVNQNAWVYPKADGSDVWRGRGSGHVWVYVSICMCVRVRTWNGFDGLYGGRWCMGIWVDRNRTRNKRSLKTPPASLPQREKQKVTERRGRLKREGGKTTKDAKRQRMTNEWKRLSRSHHQTNTWAGFPFLTDSNEKEGKNKGSSGNKELIKNSF